MFTRVSERLYSSHLISRSAARSCQRYPKVLRPHQYRQGLSLQWQQNRAYSTPPPLPPPHAESPRNSDLRSQFVPAELRPIVQPRPSRSLRPVIYAAFFLLLGLTAGQYARLIISPPILPPAESKEDQLMVEYLQNKGGKFPIVQSLSADPNWEFHDAYTGLSLEDRLPRLTTGPLAGARALGGFQRIFQNRETGELITVVWFGGAIAGWPGVTHGGAVATMLDEQLGRCAIGQFPGKTGVTANLEINYLKPTLTNSFYVIRAIPQKEGFTETKGWVTGRLETLDGRVCAEAKALFVVPKKYGTKKLPERF